MREVERSSTLSAMRATAFWSKIQPTTRPGPPNVISVDRPVRVFSRCTLLLRIV
jgi:hypothetical protein